MIKLDGVDKVYGSEAGEVRALQEVRLEVERGEFVAIMGHSGSGKSTLMNIIGCLDRPTNGRYLLDGHEVSGLPDDTRAQLRGRAFGFVFQAYNLLPRMSAVEQVELPLVYQQAPNRRARALEALARVGLLNRVRHKPNQLSGGEQQRVAIARSLVVNPLVVLADEPTGALDTTTSAEVMQLFSELVADGITVIIVTHEEDVAGYADRHIRMRDGRIISDGAQGAPRLQALS